MVAGMVLVDPEPMPARLVRGCIALSFTARVPADQSSHKGRCRRPVTPLA